MVNHRNKFFLLMIVTVSVTLITLSVTQRFHEYDLQIRNLRTNFEWNCQEIAQKLGRLQQHVTHSRDIIFTIKTAEKFHQTRLEIVLKTWTKMVKKQVFFLTDKQDSVYNKRTEKRLYATSCGKGHIQWFFSIIPYLNETLTYDASADLCCKTDKEYSLVKPHMDHQYKWWCHFDDDVYVNLRSLLDVLNEHNPSDPVYIGKTSHKFIKRNYKGKHVKIVFATGAGYCISHTLVKMMDEWIGNGRFLQTCNDTALGDDITMGLIITHLLKVPLTESTTFRTHLEDLTRVEDLKNQVTLSYSLGRNTKNVVTIPADQAAFNETVDPTRILSLHCLNVPDDGICPRR